MLPRSLIRSLAAPAVLLGLWLPGGAWAMAGMGMQATATTVATAFDELRPGSDLAEPCRPCMSCMVAPTGAVHSLNHPDGQPHGGAWPEPHPYPDRDGLWRSTAQGPPALALRIAYCRWLN